MKDINLGGRLMNTLVSRSFWFRAYKKMVLQHHPDRVSHLGEDVKNAATKKMQEINKAKDAIFTARGMK